jgi:predicted anti-sigma-YlaC factor YlaD
VRPVRDYRSMTCENVRESLSAALDGEAGPVPADDVAAHLAGCVACRAWADGAARVTRAVRVQPVEVPDLTERILTAARAEGALPVPRAHVPRRGGWPVPERLRARLRWALGGLAVAQLLLAVPDLLGALGHDAHAGREVAAFDIALAVGLLVVACYPEHAPVFAPVIFTLALCLASASVFDILQGIVSPGRVAVHALAVGQAGLVWLLARPRSGRPAPA